MRRVTLTPGVAELSDASRNYLARRPKSERSGIGQFLTPRTLRERLLDHVPIRDGDSVLDPGVGTGEFLRSCADRWAGLDLYGWDVDALALQVARELVPEAQLTETSALTYRPAQQFDVVIGNPPYFEVRGLDPELRRAYRAVLSGRPNIFSMFFQVGLEALRPGGYLGYVVPPSMNNGAFFDALRTYIVQRASVEYLEVFSDKFLFEDAQTAVQLIVLQKGGRSVRYTVDLGELGGSPRQRTLFSDKYEQVASLFAGRTTLWHLGYEAVTGSLVWNQHKQDLRDTPQEGAVPLIWAHNITAANEVQLTEAHPKKKQFVLAGAFLTGPAIVVNRITGSVGSGSLRCAVVPEGMDFAGENHVNVVRPRDGARQLIGWDELLEVLRHEGVNERVRLLTGNTQLSATELTHWLPLDVKVPNPSVPAPTSGPPAPGYAFSSSS